MLRIEKVSKTFEKGSLNEKVVFDNFSLHVDKSEFVTIIGSNGAGKSSLFNVIFGGIKVDTGKVFLDGKNITYLPSHKRAKDIGYMYQDPRSGTAPNMTIEENLFLAIGQGGWLSPMQKRKTNEFKDRLALLEMNLENSLKKPVGLLSGGQRQALSLLMATYSKPKLLLLDEHTAALDPASAQKVLSLTNTIVTENNLTCLMITHNMANALEHGNRILMMNSGKIVYDASGEEKKNMTVDGLLQKFKANSVTDLADRMVLAD